MSTDRPLRIRPPAVAGTFYPADPTELQDLVLRDLAEAMARAPEDGRPPPTP